MRATQPDLRHAHWHKSTHSNGQGGDCLEIATNIPHTVPVRDSKHPTGPTLLLGPSAWSAFVADIQQTAHHGLG